MPEEIPERRLERLAVEGRRIGPLWTARQAMLCSRSRYRPEYFHTILIVHFLNPPDQFCQAGEMPSAPIGKIKR
jgi:hypothetical protein